MKELLNIAVASMRSGGVIACPTESVWGLTCDPNNETAVGELLMLKKRPMEKGLILVAAMQKQFEDLLQNLSLSKRALLTESWPGPNTWLVSHHGKVPSWIVGVHDKVALRVTDHPIMRALCLAWDGPLVSTSANVTGHPAALTSLQVRRYFGAGVSLLVPGQLGNSTGPSAIKHLESGENIR